MWRLCSFITCGARNVVLGRTGTPIGPLGVLHVACTAVLLWRQPGEKVKAANGLAYFIFCLIYWGHVTAVIKRPQYSLRLGVENNLPLMYTCRASVACFSCRPRGFSSSWVGAGFCLTSLNISVSRLRTASPSRVKSMRGPPLSVPLGEGGDLGRRIEAMNGGELSVCSWRLVEKDGVWDEG